MSTILTDRREPAAQPPDMLRACEKRSFLKLPLAIDKPRLLAEFSRIPVSAWGVSHWDVHCSIDVLLLRGGKKGTADDFLTPNVSNNALLEQLPYIASLLAPEGPFGGAVYAFIFRTKPNGITRVHDDGNEVWRRTVRIHVPIITNPGAFLIAEGMAKHLEVGEAWTFDNQSQHSVINGDAARVHLIFDVNPNPALAALMKAATFDRGTHDPERWAITGGLRQAGRMPPLAFALGDPLLPAEKRELGLDSEGFATRITGLSKKGRLLLTPLRRGDIVTNVNGVDRSVLSRTALDHIRLKHEPGETVSLNVLRDGTSKMINIRLRADDHFSPSARISRILGRFGLKAPAQARERRTSY
jgi:kumamolisin